MSIVSNTSNPAKENPVTFQSGVAIDEKKSKMAGAFIFQAIPEDILMRVAKKKTAREVWESLKTRFVGVDQVQKASVGATLNDEELVRKLFDTVTEKYIHLVASMERYSDVEEMPFEEAICRLKAYEDRLRLRQGGSTGENSLLLTKAEGHTMSKQNSKAPSGRGRGWNGGRGSNGGRGWNGGRGGRGSTRGGRGSSQGRGDRYGKKPSQEGEYSNQNPRDKSHIKCFECQEYGHYASECTNMKKPEQEVHLTREMEEQTLLLYVKGEDIPSMVMLNEDKVFPRLYESQNSSNRDMWYLDNRLMVSDVYFILALTSNILSLSQLTKVGYDVWLHNEYLKVYNEQSTLVLKVQRSANRLYKIALKIAKPASLEASLVDDAWTWYARLGHANLYTLEFMGKKMMVTGMSCVLHPKQLCNGCVVAKQTRQSFPNEAQ
ncbi:zinc finger, CCHC-type containing protein [Tanacetum coccineum]|uniref:Zinc finger, CCHC-type containing protein n=1 Tax=Tanacetum coccineum TaxID=301880 RepID=A0ABQ5IS20_9ASTR